MGCAHPTILNLGDKERKMSKFGFQEKEWESAKEEAKEILIERAKVGGTSKGTIPYSELASNIQSIQLEAHDVRLFNLLGEISVEEDEAGRGLLTVIVVHKEGDKRPGPGFFELAEELGRDTSDIEGCWIKELNKVYKYWSVK